MKRSKSLEMSPPLLAQRPARVTLEVLPDVPAGLVHGPASDVAAAWVTPDGTRWWGLGVAARLDAADGEEARELADRARDLVRLAASSRAERAMLRCFGALAFDVDNPQAHAGWPAAAFWLPECLVRADADSVQLAVVTWRHGDEDDGQLARRHEDVCERFRERLAISAPLLPLPAVETQPDAEQRARWDRMIEAALGAIARHDFEKVVLAHGTTLAFAAVPELAAAYETLVETAHSTDRVCLRPGPGQAFLAATPEVLFAQVGDRLDVDCLAGTAPRDPDPAADAERALALVANPKERHEHQVVVDFVRQALAPHALAVTVPTAPGLRRLATLQHLHTPVHAEVNPTEPLATWLRALHPTPAVCGQPREAALDFVRANEHAPRGWYAGAIGCVGADEARFVVGLRAAVFDGARAWVPVGAGIVAGSTPEGEWLETGRKAAATLRVLEGARA